MQRYFLKNDQIQSGVVRLTEDDAHHIIRVMRMKVGDEVIVCDENKTSFIVEISFENNDVLATIKSLIKYEVELPVSVTIAQGLPKGDKFEWVLQKGTECGATHFIPVKMDRSVVKFDVKKEIKKLERWSKIVKEAAEQAHRQVLPTVHSVVSFKDLLKLREMYDVCLFAYEETAKIGEMAQLKEALKKVFPGSSILVLVGPEGGISDSEKNLLVENGFLPCALGPRILRTETAPIYILSAISYEFEL